MNKYKYIIRTYSGEKILNDEVIYLDKQGLNTHDNEVPITLGSNQLLIECD